MRKQWPLWALVLLGMGVLLCMGITIIAGLYLISSNAQANRNPVSQEEMLKLVLEWGRLAPFPEVATNVKVQTEGGSFTRSFRASFSAPEAEIRAWLAASPGTHEATPETLHDGRVKYVITPGGGANIAEVTVDFSSGFVEIYVSWS